MTFIQEEAGSYPS